MRLTVDVERPHESAVIVAPVVLGSAYQVYGLLFGQSAHGWRGMEVAEEGAESHRRGQRKAEVAAQMPQMAGRDGIRSLLLATFGEAANAIADIIGHKLLFGDILLAPQGGAPASHRSGQGDGLETATASLQQNLRCGSEPGTALRSRHQGHKHLGIAVAGTEKEVCHVHLIRECHLAHPRQHDFGEIALQDMLMKTLEIFVIMKPFRLLPSSVVRCGKSYRIRDGRLHVGYRLGQGPTPPPGG